MELVALAHAEAVARAAAGRIAEAARRAVAARGRFVLAVSGGSTPARMLACLAQERVPWERVHLFQVDERVAPDGDPARNRQQLETCLLDRVEPGQVVPMPVWDAARGEPPDLEGAAVAYRDALAAAAGDPPVLDLVHLGLGDDGHTASLVPGDPVLAVRDRDVAATGPYRGHRRLTLTYPVLERAREILWVVTGAGKADVLPRLLAGDAAIPAGAVAQRERAVVLADAAAAASL